VEVQFAISPSNFLNSVASSLICGIYELTVPAHTSSITVVKLAPISKRKAEAAANKMAKKPPQLPYYIKQ
jgi:hypothetical protein